MKDFFKNLIVVAVGCAILYGTYAYFQKNQRKSDNKQTLAKPGQNNTDFPLEVPDNFKIEVLAKELTGARVMAIDGFGNMWVSQTKLGKISMIEIKDQATPVVHDGVLTNLTKPHGLAFSPSEPFVLYFAEENKISKVQLYSDSSPQKIIDLPKDAGKGHFTRTIKFNPADNRLFVSIGSSCNVCHESDPLRAAIYSLNSDGSDFKLFARGLRNSVFFDWSFVDGKLWGTDMGRDFLGRDLPPDEINIIEQDGDYGWPICYGKNIHDIDFDKNVYIQDPCNDKILAYIEIPAHYAPLGLAFVPEKGWPKEMWGDLIIAYHHSNSAQQDGFKLVRVKLSEKGEFEGFEDFVTGWRKGEEPLGKPVDVLIQPGGVMYVSDDTAGQIYKITYLGDE